jgi:hypothetical protein
VGRGVAEDPVAGCAVELAVVALAQPPVEQHRDVAAGEGDPDRLDRSVQVGAEHRREPVVTPPLPQPDRLTSPDL